MNTLRKRAVIPATGLSTLARGVDAIGFPELRGMFIETAVRKVVQDTLTFETEGADHANR